MTSGGLIARCAGGLGALALGLALAGCGLGAGDSAGEVSLRVTDDFGRVTLLEPEQPKQAGADTVMRLLQRNAKVQTRYGGGFVQAINGRAGEVSANSQVDWFFYMNGVLADQGSASWRLKAGERVWWDRHRWETAQVGAVVGSYPEPLLSGHGGRYRGALLDCRAGAATCDLAERQLRRDGITVTRGSAKSPDAGQTRVVVGPWKQVRTAAPELASLKRGPADSGVFARVAADGEVTATDADAKPVPTAPGGALIAALRQGEHSPVWVVTGPTDAAVKAAVARGLHATALTGKVAVLVPVAGAKIDALPARGADTLDGGTGS